MRIILIGIMFFMTTPWIYASDLTEVWTRVAKIQAASPAGTPTAPASMDQKGYIGDMLGRVFYATGMIKNQFITAFQSIEGNFANTLPRWDGLKFVWGTIRDDGTNLGIGTGVLNNRRMNILWDINFSGDLYKNGTLLNMVYTSGDQTIGGIKTFTANPMIQNSSPTNYFLDTNHRSAMVHVNNNQFYILRWSSTGSSTWAQYNSMWPLQINLENNNSYFWGNIGIWTTTPQAKLHINSVIDANLTSTSHGLTIWQQSGINLIIDNNEILARNNNSASHLYIQHEWTAWNTIMNANSGNVGIGTLSPTAKLHVSWNIIASTPTASNHVATKGYVDNIKLNYHLNVLKASRAWWNSFWTEIYPNTDRTLYSNYSACFLTTNSVEMANDSQYTGGWTCELYHDGTNWILNAQADKRMRTICKASCIK